MADTLDSIRLNSLKHHARYIRTFVQVASLHELPAWLKTIGGSRMDLYTGDLQVETIADEVRSYLQQNGIFLKEKYTEWIWTQGDYQTVTLSDKSVWVLRKGNDSPAYIHIHPGRYSLHSLRVDANVLKTVIACGVCLKENSIQDLSLRDVNYVRKEFLDLPPVREIADGGSLKRLMDLLLTCGAMSRKN